MGNDYDSIPKSGEDGQRLYQAPSDMEWYALYVQVNHEREVVKRLEQKEVICFLPLMETWSKRLDRRKKIHLPMFPGYVFINVILDNYMNLTVVKTPGALNLLHNSEHGNCTIVLCW